MSIHRSDDGGLRTAALVLVGLILVLGLRVRATLAIVNPDRTIRNQAPPASAVSVDAERLNTQRRLLAEGAVTRRDPFRREAKGMLPQDLPLPAQARRKIRRLTTPVISALIHDHHDPMTQITVNGERSDWLRPGDTFHGWTVTAITPRTVTITKGGRKVILP